PNELLPVRRGHSGALQRTPADEVGLVLADGPRKTRIVWSHRAIRVLANDDVALLGPQHVHRLGAIRGDSVLLPGLDDRLPDCRTEIRRYVDLESELAGEADAHKEHGDAADPSACDAHMRHGRSGDVDTLHERLQYAAGVRALHGDHGPLLGGRREPDVEIGPFRLPVVLHQREDACGAARSRRDMKPIISRAGHHAVVIYEAIVPQKNAIAAAPDGEAGPGIDVHPVHESRGVLAHHLDLAERRAVEDSAMLAHRETFACHGGVHALPGTREVASALPQADVLEYGAVASRPVVHRRGPYRVEQLATREARETAEAHRRIRHTERREADLRHWLVELARDDRERVDVGRFALVRRHPGGGVALDVLDGAKAFTGGQSEVPRRDIVLPIDEGLARTRTGRLRQR